MATVNPAYSGSSPTTITISPASLASSSSLTAGRESNEIDNTSNKYVDAYVRGLITVGTTPTANTLINIYAWGAQVSLATTALDVLDGTDSAETITNTGVLAAGLRLAAQVPVLATTSDIGYSVYFSVRRALRLPTLPPFWGLFVAHNTGVNLNATAGNHVFSFVGVTYTIA